MSKKRRDTVRQEIERAMNDPPTPRDPRRLLEYGLTCVVRISQGEDPKYALEAGRWLVEYATRELEQRRQRVKPKASQDRSDIISDLRGLYAKALNGPPGTSPLVVESIELVPDS